MSGEVKTYSINDERINVESEVEIAVKNSIQSGIVQKYQQSSLSSSSVMYNINVPSENTLVSKNIQIDAVMWFRVTLTQAMADAFNVARQSGDQRKPPKFGWRFTRILVQNRVGLDSGPEFRVLSVTAFPW